MFQTKETIMHCANSIKQNRASMGGMGEPSRAGWEGVGAKSGMKIADHWRRTSMEGVLPLS